MAAITELVFEVKEMLEQLQVVYWVDSGTLLGQYRMEEVIPWDLDGDVGIFDDGFEKLRTTELKISSGYELNVWNSSIYTRHDRGPDLPARLIDTTYGFYVDIFVFSPTLSTNRGESMVGPLPSLAWNSCAGCRVVNPEGESTTKEKLKRFVVPLNWIVPTQRCSLNDFYVMCPAQPVPYLQELYGEEFLNPIVW
ncbi:hypothetical protein Poli38472_009631 [Pythium oligandrum]|uniref:LicD/FKTN/FKRP nucleotidyltransferase domain-containing protein n=1 Tax=Pythium oligandrum TaxID=41045 RepID=A0A8K1CGL0_PYTOL|nr:hypothetical protein Poli38472_009631 [Pythium oligandrum]|eukprot:TMW62138.1 hypothetical protein Poli38472_009631 [Pythium oligandrum]